MHITKKILVCIIILTQLSAYNIHTLIYIGNIHLQGVGYALRTPAILEDEQEDIELISQFLSDLPKKAVDLHYPIRHSLENSVACRFHERSVYEKRINK